MDKRAVVALVVAAACLGIWALSRTTKSDSASSPPTAPPSSPSTIGATVDMVDGPSASTATNVTPSAEDAGALSQRERTRLAEDALDARGAQNRRLLLARQKKRLGKLADRAEQEGDRDRARLMRERIKHLEEAEADGELHDEDDLGDPPAPQ